MIKKNFTFILSIFILLTTFWACSQASKVGVGDQSNQSTSLTELDFTVEEAPEWTSLFKRSSGWFGGDGIFAIPTNGVDSAQSSDSTMFLFSDSLIGELEDGELDSFTMVNNSVAIVTGPEPTDRNIKFFWARDESGDPATMFVPKTPNSKPNDYYWLGDGFVNTAKNNSTYIFAYRINNTGAETFGFMEVGTALIILPPGSKPPFPDQRQIDTPLFIKGETPDANGSFGVGLFINTKGAGAPDPDGYLYVYGVKGKTKEVLVSRVQPQDIEDFSKWRFWDGRQWQKDMMKAAPIADKSSNEMSVTPLPDGRYAMVFQTEGIGRTVGLRLGLSPQGPFGPIIPIWDCSKDLEGENFVSYNAKVHTNLSKPDKLLISYNINSFDFTNDIQQYPTLYRPRFIWVNLQ